MGVEGELFIDLSNEDEFPLHGPMLLIDLISDSSSDEGEVDHDILAEDHDEQEDFPMAPGTVFPAAPEIHEEQAMTGVAFDPSRGPVIIRAMLAVFPN